MMERKIKAVWTKEAQEDLFARHNLEAENQLSDILAKEILAEIDREILNDLANNAGHMMPKSKHRKQYRSIDADWEISKS